MESKGILIGLVIFLAIVAIVLLIALIVVGRRPPAPAPAPPVAIPVERGLSVRATPPPERSTQLVFRHAARPTAAVPAPAPAPRAPPALEPVERLIVDATVVGTTLFSLDEEGTVRATPLAQDRTCDLGSAAQPEPMSSLATTGSGSTAALAAVGRTSRSIYTLSPCSGARRGWVRQTVPGALTTQVRHISASPDGMTVWTQNDRDGQMHAVDGGRWEPIGSPVPLGSAHPRRILGGRDEFVDLADGQAVRNARPGSKIKARAVLYRGTAVRSRSVGDEKPQTCSPAAKRVAPGRVVEFPLQERDLVEQLTPKNRFNDQ